jgi:hypothetical protein
MCTTLAPNKSSSETAPFDRSVKLKQRNRAAESCRQHYNHLLHFHQNDTPRAAPSKRHNNEEPLPYDYFHREIAHKD